jgi:hypothetical protein
MVDVGQGCLAGHASGRTTPGSVIEKILPMVRPYQKAPPVSTPFSVKLRVK